MREYSVSMSLDQALRQFLEFLEIEQGRSRLTLRNYDHYMTIFLQFCAQEKVTKPEEITQEHMRLYRLWLNKPHKHPLRAEYIERSKKTQNYYLIALRAFLKFLSDKDIASLSPEKINLAKAEDKQITFLTPEEIDRLLGQPDPLTVVGHRDRALLEMLFSTGLRISELTNLNRDDIYFDTGELSVQGKRGKIRVVFISDEAKKYLKSYLNKRHDDDKALFIRTHTNQEDVRQKDEADDIGLRLSPRSVQRMVQKYAKEAGIAKSVTPHLFRHTFATDLIQNGADLRSVQELLGHSSVTTTQVYTHVTNPQLQEVHKAFHARRQHKPVDEPKPDPDQSPSAEAPEAPEE
jgi:site-specific recombinase XerD